jgi:hypothetical protein
MQVAVADLDKKAYTRGHIMVDTGAAFTMVTTQFCKVHNLTVNKMTGSYRQADGVTPGKISGYVEMSM